MLPGFFVREPFRRGRVGVTEKKNADKTEAIKGVLRVKWEMWGAECGVWKMRSVKNAECGECGVLKMWSVENEECGKFSLIV